MKTVDDVVPGYETDLEIHCRFFGNRKLTTSEMCNHANEVWRTQPACRVFEEGTGSGFSYAVGQFRQDARAYSTSNSLAWRIIERFEKLGFEWVISGGAGNVKFSTGAREKYWHSASAPTFALAVCRVALLWTTTQEYLAAHI